MTRREFFQRRIPRYRKDPLLFFKEVTHFEPDPWQREAAVAVSQHRRVAIRSGQGVGKTALEANLMWWFIACFPTRASSAPHPRCNSWTTSCGQKWQSGWTQARCFNDVHMDEDPRIHERL